MKWSTIPKAGCLAVLAVPAYVAGVAAYDIGRTILKHPRTTLVATAMTGFLWYNCPDVKQQANTLAHNTVQTVQAYRQERAQERRDNVRIVEMATQYDQLEKELNQTRQQYQQTQQEKQQLEQQKQQAEQQKQQLEQKVLANEQAIQQTSQAAQQAEQRYQETVQQYQQTQQQYQQSEQEKQRLAQQKQQLERTAQERQAYASTLEKKLAAKQQAPPQPASPPPAPQPADWHSIADNSLTKRYGQTGRIKVQPHQVMLTPDPEFRYDYVDVDETLERIGRRISSRSDAVRIIERDNNITDSRTLMAGQVIRIRRSICDRDISGTFEGRLDLQSIVLSGTERISDRFDDAATILNLQEQLGVHLQDGFKYSRGSRVVHY